MRGTLDRGHIDGTVCRLGTPTRKVKVSDTHGAQFDPRVTGLLPHLSLRAGDAETLCETPVVDDVPIVAGKTPPTARYPRRGTRTLPNAPCARVLVLVTKASSAFRFWPGETTDERDFAIMILPQVHLRKPCYDFYFL